MGKQYYIYILSNFTKTVLYAGVTDNLVKRVYQHKQKLVDGFTAKYHVDRLVYYEIFQDPETAITREKTIKNLVRRKKNALIDTYNPAWEDLYEKILLK